MQAAWWAQLGDPREVIFSGGVIVNQLQIFQSSLSQQFLITILIARVLLVHGYKMDFLIYVNFVSGIWNFGYLRR